MLEIILIAIILTAGLWFGCSAIYENYFSRAAAARRAYERRNGRR